MINHKDAVGFVRDGDGRGSLKDRQDNDDRGGHPGSLSFSGDGYGDDGDGEGDDDISESHPGDGPWGWG